LFDDDQKGFGTNNSPNSNICLSFNSHQVSISNYLLQSGNNDWGDGHRLSNWKLEGSNDKINWTMIDCRNNESSLNGYRKESKFQCQPSQPFSHIRLTQTGKNLSGFDYLILSFIEFSGKIT
jgi:hypothetical protein